MNESHARMRRTGLRLAMSITTMIAIPTSCGSAQTPASTGTNTPNAPANPRDGLATRQTEDGSTEPAASMDAATIARETVQADSGPAIDSGAVGLDVPEATLHGTVPRDAGAPSRADAQGSRPASSDSGRATARPGTPVVASTTAASAASGRTLFDRVCGRCHPGGNEDTGPRILGIAWSEARVRTQIRSGSARMRAIATSRLADADMPALITYLRSLRVVR